MSEQILDGLNPEQRKAASTIEGPLLVLAGAGTGKTRVITARIAYMISQGIPPENILGVTFTNKAASEMRERMERMIGAEQARKVTLGTFHSICGRILRKDINKAGHFDSNFSIADTSDQTSIIRQAAAEFGYAKEEMPTAVVQSYIGRCKNNMIFPAAALSADNTPEEQRFAEIYERYQQLLELQNTVDFDDMLLLTVRIFEEHPEVLQAWRSKYRYLLVDEYQDTNISQFRFLQLLAGDKPNLCVVGDDDQSIYAWRGADISNILDFPEIFPGTVRIKLEQNYRSTNNILRSANAVIAGNSKRYDKQLWSANGDGDKLKVVSLPSGDEEAVFVADAVNEFLRNNPEYSYKDCAILYRSNYLSRAFEQEFRRRGISPTIIGGQEFFERKEVKDAAAYLKLVMNPRDDQSLLRIISVPPRGIGDKAILKLRSTREETKIPMTELLVTDSFLSKLSGPAGKSAGNLGEIIQKYREGFKEPGQLFQKAQAYLDDTGFLSGFQRLYKDIKEARDRKENVFEFLNCIAQYEERCKAAGEDATLERFMENYSLMDDQDRTAEAEGDGPILTTVHASKGLEFPCVFLVGMEQGLFPHERSLSEGNEEEERRLFYVAITRAKRTLVLTLTKQRFRYGQNEPRYPSPFLEAIPDELADKPAPDEFFPRLSLDDRKAAFAEILRQLQEDQDF